MVSILLIFNFSIYNKLPEDDWCTNIETCSSALRKRYCKYILCICWTNIIRGRMPGQRGTAALRSIDNACWRVQPCAVQRSAFSRVAATRAKTWTLLCKIAPSKNKVAWCGFFGQKEWNLWKFTVVCWLSMDRAPWVNERFMSGWKGLNRVEHVLLMEVVLDGHQHRAAEKLLLRRNTETSWTI